MVNVQSKKKIITMVGVNIINNNGLHWSPSKYFNKPENQKESFEGLDELGINNSFIIHRLWTIYVSYKYIQDCNPKYDIEMSFIQEYENKIVKMWPWLDPSDDEI